MAATHLRRWWLPYLLTWLTLASTVTLEAGRTSVAQAAVFTGMAITAAVVMIGGIRRTGRLLRHAMPSRRDHPAKSPQR